MSQSGNSEHLLGNRGLRIIETVFPTFKTPITHTLPFPYITCDGLSTLEEDTGPCLHDSPSSLLSGRFTTSRSFSFLSPRLFPGEGSPGFYSNPCPCMAISKTSK